MPSRRHDGNALCKEVALISMRTLTFIKPVLKKIRLRAQMSKILQMPLIDANGKYSYPLELKRRCFLHFIRRLNLGMKRFSFTSAWKMKLVAKGFG